MSKHTKKQSFMDRNHKIEYNRLIDKYDQVKKYHSVEYTDFLTPDVIHSFMHVLYNLQNVSFTVTGGYEGAEYQIIILYPDYYTLEESDLPFEVVRFTPLKKCMELEHRDILGSVLGEGIKRHKTGDIRIHKNFSQMIVLSSMASIIAYSLKRIGHEAVEVSTESIVDLVPVDETYKEMVCVVPSLRLDALIAAVWNISRGKASDLIKADKVKVNYRTIQSVGHTVKQSDMISCRGKGRFHYDGTLTETKKGRLRIDIRLVQ